MHQCSSIQSSLLNRGSARFSRSQNEMAAVQYITPCGCHRQLDTCHRSKGSVVRLRAQGELSSLGEISHRSTKACQLLSGGFVPCLVSGKTMGPSGAYGLRVFPHFDLSLFTKMLLGQQHINQQMRLYLWQNYP